MRARSTSWARKNSVHALAILLSRRRQTELANRVYEPDHVQLLISRSTRGWKSRAFVLDIDDELVTADREDCAGITPHSENCLWHGRGTR
jgi:hypothetical protein